MARLTMAGFTVVLALAGCVTQVDSPDPAPGAVTVRSRLSEGPTLEVADADSLIRVTSVLMDDAAGPVRSELPVARGELGFRVTDGGDIELRHMAVDLDDVEIRRGTIDLTLTDLVLSLVDPVVGQTTWVDGAAHAEVRAELVLSWSLVREDGSSPWPLEPQHVGDVVLGIEITKDADGSLRAVLDATRAGALFRWAGLVELRDLDLHLAANEGP